MCIRDRYYRGKLATQYDPAVWKFHRTYTPKKVYRTMSKKKFNDQVYPRFEDYLSMKKSKIKDKKISENKFKKSPVKIPKGSRLKKKN